ncbi:MAG: Holliday junction branch migration protein RuvA [Dialister sp.]|nr:Holliday junction branch migration protein RuvA [Dialister sp.]
MIGYIRGEITERFKDYCFIETGGIGYRVFLSGKDRDALQTGETAKFLTYMAVREDAILLYGFLSREAYDLFLLLISVSKIGPKVAMGILSAMDPAAFARAIRNRDLTALTRLPGVGKKTGERLLVEMKDKIGTLDIGGEPSADNHGISEEDTLDSDAMKALLSLGYDRQEIRPLLARLAPQYKETAALISAVLREFGKARD